MVRFEYFQLDSDHFGGYGDCLNWGAGRLAAGLALLPGKLAFAICLFKLVLTGKKRSKAKNAEFICF